jgi:hypothetical protein
MEKRWKDVMVQNTIGGMPRRCVCYWWWDSEIITIFVLCFDVSLKHTLHLLNFEGTQCSTA